MKRRPLTGDLPHFPLHVFLLFWTVVAIYPMLWVFTVAFSGRQALSIVDLPSDPTILDRLRTLVPLPAHPSWSNFVSVLTDQPFALWLLNSANGSAATTVVGVALACTSAYAFSRFGFPGRQTGLMAFLVSQMFPGTLMLIPLYIAHRKTC